MKQHIFRSFLCAAILVPLAFVAGSMSGCGGSGGTGQLAVSLTDAATDQYNAVYVTVAEVSVHAESDAGESWTTVATPNKTINLLDLVGGVREDLGLASLDAGHYTQMRLKIGTTPDSGINILSHSHPFANYVIDTANEYHELKVPSGEQSGIKIVQGFDINENSTTEIVLDFDASASVVVAGASGQYLLKPTIKVLETTLAAIVSGVVSKDADGSAIGGALLSAQRFDSGAADPKDQVIVEAATLTDDAGAYKLFIAEGAYTLVTTKEGFAPSAVAFDAVAGSTSTQDFSLVAADDGTAAGTVTIAGADAETYGTLSFRQEVMVGSENTTIEVFAINVANGGSYSVALPAGSYAVVSSTFGKATQKADITVTAGATTPLDVAF
jgi:Domain of unknown function (DUF4382)